jgi:hypothetical protein
VLYLPGKLLLHHSLFFFFEVFNLDLRLDQLALDPVHLFVLFDHFSHEVIRSPDLDALLFQLVDSQLCVIQGVVVTVIRECQLNKVKSTIGPRVGCRR